MKRNSNQRDIELHSSLNTISINSEITTFSMKIGEYIR